MSKDKNMPDDKDRKFWCLDGNRDEMVRAVMSAPKDARILVIVDDPPNDNVRIITSHPKNSRALAFFATILQAFAGGSLQQKK